MSRALSALALSLALSLPAGAATTERILSDLVFPVYVTAPAGDPRVFVVGLLGDVRIWDGADGFLDPPFLDISARVDTGFSEGGLLSIAFPPDFATSGVFYAYYTVTGPGGGDPLTSRISRFRVSPGDPDVALSGEADEKVLLTQVQPAGNHNGGTLAFAEDGTLFFGFGDGGDQRDPREGSQRGDTLLGKMIRIDVSHTDFDDDYTVPPDNPFVGDPTVLDEIWAIGFRNPFRWSFDRATGDLYVADVGQDAREEIDVEPRPDPGAPAPVNPGGRNYGWDVMEGTSCFDDSADGGPDPGEPPCNDPSLTLPVHEYSHGVRGSITGGVVYRGSAGDLQGQYLFGDFNSGELLSIVWDGAGGTVGGENDLTAELAPDVGSIQRPVAFGEDGFGDVYIVDIGLGSSGAVYRIVPEPAQALLLAVGAATLLAARRRR